MEEYYDQSSKESIFIHQCDKLEAILQANIYNSDCNIMSNQNQRMFNKVRHSGINIEDEDNIVDLFIKNSLQKKHFDDNFLQIINQIKKK